MIILFEESRATGYAREGFETSQENLEQKKSSETGLNGLVPESFEGDWKDNIEYFKLDKDNNIVFDESYQPESGGS